MCFERYLLGSLYESKLAKNKKDNKAQQYSGPEIKSHYLQLQTVVSNMSEIVSTSHRFLFPYFLFLSVLLPAVVNFSHSCLVEFE